MRWRIYYGDGSTFSDRDGTPFDAPAVDVQAVALAADTPTGFVVSQGKDAHYWRPDLGWQGCDLAGLWDYLMLHRGPKAVLFGRSIRDEDYWAVVARATREGLGD